MAERASLLSLVERRDLILVTGKGGTGKSTLVAALAQLAAQRRGGAVAVELSAHPRLGAMIPLGAGVSAVNLDAEQIFAPALGRLVGLPAIATAVLKQRTLRLFFRTSPAIREMVVLDELSHLVEKSSKAGHPVIVDLPATGHALSLLDTPRSVRRMLKVGPLAHIAERVERLLLDAKRCELVIVALPEELPINETIDLLERVGQLGIASRVVVVNQVPVQPVALTDRSLLEVIQRHGGEVGRLAGAARNECEGADLARAQIDRLKSVLHAQVVELPLYPLHDPRSCAEAMALTLAS